MDKIKIERTWLQGSPVQVDNLMGNAFVGEAGAHEFLISGKDNAGNVVPITGTITGKFLSSTMTTFALSGYVAEGVASVTLPSECYGAPGQFVVSIFATNGSTTTCIYCGVGSIFRTSTAAIAYPTTTLPDLTLLINQLDDVIASFPADLSHLLGAIAPTFVDNQPFTAGQYVWYNQVLYRFTADHPAGSWAGSADTVVAVVGTELNSTVRYTQQVLTDAQKTVARTNIDAADADDVTDLELTTVQVTPQTFDDNSKSQARSNIGAASSGDLNALSTIVNNQGGYIGDLTAAVGTVPTGETVEGQIGDLKSAIDVLEPTATAEDVGKSLVAKAVSDGKVSEYELTTIDAGLSTSAKNALLACFRHVVWVDEDGQDYLDALTEELLGGVVRITATYVSEGHTVYQYDTLESLKPYITVLGYYADGTSKSIAVYTLSGNLNSAVSTITVEYAGKSTQISVPVYIDSSLLYYAPRGHVLDGTSETIIDTGVKVADADKTITILFDVTDDFIAAGGKTSQLVYNIEKVNNVNAGYSITMVAAQSDGGYNKKYGANVGASSTTWSDTVPNTAHTIKGACQHVANSNNFKFTLYIDDVAYVVNQEASCTFNISSLPLVIGARNAGNFTWTGVINLLNIYSRELSLSEIKTILGVA